MSIITATVAITGHCVFIIVNVNARLLIAVTVDSVVKAVGIYILSVAGPYTWSDNKL